MYCLRLIPGIIVAAIAAASALPASAQQTPEEWITLGRRVHGGFGTFIPVGIRIGQDAMERLEAGPRDLAVTYFDSDKAPCACVSDGIMIATTASPGQRSLSISPQKAPEGAMAMAVIRHKRTGKSFRYTVAEKWLLQLAQWNKTLDERGRCDEVMKAEGLFDVAEEK